MRDYYSMTNEEKDAHHEQWGKPNSFPPGWKEITAAKFAECGFFTWCIELIENRTMFHLKEMTVDGKTTVIYDQMGDQISARLFFTNDGRGYAISNQVYDSKKREWRGHSTGEVFYFEFGCKHEWDGELTPQERQNIGPLFRCEHVVKCSKCGHVWRYDSSD